MPNTVTLTLPLSEAAVRGLSLGDIVYLSGDAYTMMYVEHYTRIFNMLAAGETLPMELPGAAIYHTGTIFRRREDGSYDFRAIGATTSSKFNAHTPELIRRTGIRAVIGKGGMDRATLEAMQWCGRVYLAIVGGCSAIYTSNVQLVEEYWPQPSWADNQLRLRLTNLGPLTVAMDAHGNSLYSQPGNAAEETRALIYRSLGIVDQ